MSSPEQPFDQTDFEHTHPVREFHPNGKGSKHTLAKAEYIPAEIAKAVQKTEENNIELELRSQLRSEQRTAKRAKKPSKFKKGAAIVGVGLATVGGAKAVSNSMEKTIEHQKSVNGNTPAMVEKNRMANEQAERAAEAQSAQVKTSPKSVATQEGTLTPGVEQTIEQPTTETPDTGGASLPPEQPEGPDTGGAEAP